MVENFQAVIGAKINEFNRKMKQVDKKVRETAFEATKPIGANIKEFMAKMKAIQATAKRVLKRDDKTISADISRFMRKAKEVAVVARALNRDRIVIPVKMSITNYKNTMGRIASFSRAIEEITQMTTRGILISISPAIVPILASVVGLLGQLGPMLGTIAGSTFALGTAFVSAGIGAAAFGAVAVPTIKKVFDENAKLNAQQKKAKLAVDSVKASYSQLVKATEKPVLEAFTTAMHSANFLLLELKPLFISSAKAVSTLMDSFNRSLDTRQVREFLDYLNKDAAPLLITTGKAVGNFFKGLGSMMVAFGPLSKDTANGFLKMSEGFAEWSAKLSESTKFQAFVDYVKENMPKIRSIFSDAIQGIINVFAAFAPSSADMMTSLQDMMERFKEWSSTLAENQSFQDFIKYVQENGPKVVDLIGNLTTFLVNLGVALAPVGSFMLDVVNRFLEFTSALLENHPWIGKVMGAVIVLGGAFFAALPHINGMIALFGGLTGPMGLAAGKMIATAATFIGKWALMAAKATLSAAKQAAAWALSTGAALAKATGRMITTAALFVAKWVWMGVQALAQAARMAAAWFIALGPVGWVIGAIVALAILIIANWDKIKSATVKIWNNVSNAVKLAWLVVKAKTAEALIAVSKIIAKMPAKVAEFAGKMLSAGKDLIRGLINGIKGMAKDALGAITGVVGSVVSKAKSLLKIHSPSRVMMAIGKFVGQGLAKGITGTTKQVVSAGSTLTKKLTSAISSYSSILKRKSSSKKEKRFAASQINALKQTKLYATREIATLTSIAKKREAIAEKMKTAKKKLEDAIKLRADFAKSVREDAMNFGSVMNSKGTTGDDILKDMQDRLKKIKEFAANIAKLQKLGLNKGTLEEIVSAGVESGGAKAAILANSSNSVITQINNTQKQITKNATSLGNKTAQQFYGLGVDAARGMIKGLESQAKALEKSAKKISDALVKSVKRRLDIHSPSRVFAKIGAFITQGLAIGIEKLSVSPVKSIADIAAQMSRSFNPKFAFPGFQSDLSVPIQRSDIRAVEHSFTAQIGTLENHEPDMYLVVDGRELGKVVAEPVRKENEMYEDKIKIMRGR